MKGKKFLAALLCAAMVVTSTNVDVSASMLDELLLQSEDGDVIYTDESNFATEESDEILLSDEENTEKSVNEEIVTDEKIGEAIGDNTDELLLESTVSGNSFEELSVAENEADEALDVTDELVALGEAGENPYFENSSTLTLKEGITSLASLNVTSVTIPSCVTRIPAEENLFKGNTKINIVIFPADSKLETIDEKAFANSSITAFSAPKNLDEIPEECFMGCDKLKSIAFANVTEIGNYAFKDCRALTSESSIAGGNDIDTIGNGAFENTGFTNFYFSTIGNSYGNELKLGDGVFANCIDLKRVIISDKVKEIPVNTFKGCSALANVNFGSGVETILKDAFYKCKSLTTINFRNVEEIGNLAFHECSALAKVNFGDKLKAVGSQAFLGCAKLVEATFNYKNEDSIADDVEIADDAFDNPTGMTIKGYDGAVKDFAEKMHVKSYVSLNKGWNFAVKNGDFSKHASVTSNLKSYKDIKPGTEVEIIIKVKDGFLVRDSLVNEAADGATVSFKYLGEYNGSVKFSFEMPNSDVVLNGWVLANEYAKYLESYSIDKYNEEQPFYYTGTGYAVECTGKKGVIHITGNKKGQNSVGSYALGEWMFNYSVRGSSVKVSTDGVVTSVNVGQSTVICTLKSDPSVSKEIKIQVGSKKEVDYMRVECTDKEDEDLGVERLTFYDGPWWINDEDGIKRYRTDYEEDVEVMNYEKNSIALKSRTLETRLLAYTKDDDSVYATATWKSSDEAVAKLEYKTTGDNYNKITIPKGASGEAMITVSVKTADRDEKNQEITRRAHYIIRVNDNTPRLKQSTVTVNKQSSAGALITLVPVEDVEFTVSPELYLGNSGNPDTFKGLMLTEDKDAEEDGNVYYRLKCYDPNAKDIAQVTEGLTQVRTGKNKLYIRVHLDTEEAANVYSYIPINTLNVINQKLNPTVKVTSGKINLFYNADCYKDDDGDDDDLAKLVGKVKLSQSIKDSEASIKNWGLMSVANYNYYIAQKASSPEKDEDGRLVNDYDSFKNNFDLVYDSDTNGFTVTRSARPLQKNTVKGYIGIRYEGFNEYVYKAITIPTTNKGPNLVLSKTTVTVNTNNCDNKFPLSFLDKKTKKIAVSANELAEDGLEINEKKTSRGMFEISDDMNDEGEFRLEIIGNATPGKAVINLRLSTWDKPVEYTFTLKTTSKKPATKVTPGTVTVNKGLDVSSTYAKVTLNQPDCHINEMEIEPTGNAKQLAEAEKLSLEWNDEEQKIEIEIGDDSIKTGSYKFKVHSTTEYSGGAEDILKDVVFTVKVINKVPTLKLSRTSFNFNTKYPGTEIYDINLTLGNISSNIEETEIDFSDMELISKKVGYEEIGEGLQIVDDSVIYNEAKKKWVASVYYPEAPSVKTFNALKFDVQGITVNGSEIKPFTVTLKGTNSNAEVSVKAAKTLNPIDGESYIAYTPVFKGLTNARIAENGIKVLEYSSQDKKYIESERFYFAEHNEDDAVNTYRLMINEDLEDDYKLKANTSYTVRFEYDLCGSEEVTLPTTNVKVTPKQTLSKLTASTSKCVFYARQAEENRKCHVDMTKTSCLRGIIDEVKISDSNSNMLKSAFSVSEEYNNEDDEYVKYGKIDSSAKTCKAGGFDIICTNPSLLKHGTTYTLKLEFKFKGQLENSTGQVIDMKVVVNK